MMPTINCPYKGLTAVCWTCPNHIADTDECCLNSLATVETSNTGTNNNAVSVAQTYEERLRDYEKRRQELLQLSKETLVDLIIHRPSY